VTKAVVEMYSCLGWRGDRIIASLEPGKQLTQMINRWL